MSVTATEANRSFSKLLRAAQSGTRVTITSRGHAIAELVPAAGDNPSRAAVRDELLSHWASLPVIRADPWTREELYDRDE